MNENAHAILLLCSRMGISQGDPLKPLTPREWSDLTAVLKRSGMSEPQRLLSLSVQELESRLGVATDTARRLADLFERGGGLGLELERLESLGIWVLTCADHDYPERWRERLGKLAPPVLFGCGSRRLLNKQGLAVVGSRDASETAQSAARFAGQAAAVSGLVLVSGGARGIDQLAMAGAVEAGGQSVGVLADSLERTIRGPEVRDLLAQDNLVLITTYAPNAGFSVGNAMGRNKLIYTLADFALVAASDAEKGGTWAGAIEALQHRWIPVFVCAGDGFPNGNQLLLKKGAQPFAWPTSVEPHTLVNWLQGRQTESQPHELFS